MPTHLVCSMGTRSSSGGAPASTLSRSATAPVKVLQPDRRRQFCARRRQIWTRPEVRVVRSGGGTDLWRRFARRLARYGRTRIFDLALTWSSSPCSSRVRGSCRSSAAPCAKLQPRAGAHTAHVRGAAGAAAARRPRRAAAAQAAARCRRRGAAMRAAAAAAVLRSSCCVGGWRGRGVSIVQAPQPLRVRVGRVTAWACEHMCTVQTRVRISIRSPKPQVAPVQRGSGKRAARPPRTRSLRARASGRSGESPCARGACTRAWRSCDCDALSLGFHSR